MNNKYGGIIITNIIGMFLIIAAILAIAAATYWFMRPLPLGLVDGDVVNCGRLYYVSGGLIYGYTANIDSVDIVKMFPVQYLEELKPHFAERYITPDLYKPMKSVVLGDVLLCNNMPKNNPGLFRMVEGGLKVLTIPLESLPKMFYKLVKYKVIQNMAIIG